jgi:hypothetical protein
MEAGVTDRGDSLATARRLMRGFRSAPDPIRQARAIHQALCEVPGLSPAQYALIEALRRLLDARSNIAAVEGACRKLIGALPAD